MESFINAYQSRINGDLGLVGLLERAVMLTGHIIPGVVGIDDLSYLFSSLSRLLRHTHDVLLSNASITHTREHTDSVDSLQMKLIHLLAVLEDVDIIAELMARRIGGSMFQYKMILLIELIRAASRLLLLLKHGNHTFDPKIVFFLDREKLVCQDCAKGQLLVDGICPICDPELFQRSQECAKTGDFSQLLCPTCGDAVDLKTLWSWVEEHGLHSKISFYATPEEVSLMSGQICRACRLRRSRAFQAASAYTTLQQRRTKGLVSSRLSLPIFAAEILDIVRPVVHLCLQGFLGKKSWVAYNCSLLMDLAIMYFRAISFSNLHPREKRQHQRRAMQLLKYFLRSPVLDDYTMKYLIAIIHFVRNYVPLGGIISSSMQSQLQAMTSLYTLQWSDRIL